MPQCGVTVSLGGILKVQGLLVIIPTLNERDNIVEQIRRVKRVSNEIEILVVDDQSQDGTADQVRSMMNNTSGLHLIERHGTRGLGLAYRQGIRFAAQHGYPFIAQMDGDLSHNPKYLVPMMQAIEHADFCMGSRYMNGGSARYSNPLRAWLSRSANHLLRKRFGVPFKDLTTGFTSIRTEALKRLNWEEIPGQGFGFQFALKINLWRQGAIGCEVPIRFVPRVRGRSKLRVRDLFEAVRQLRLSPSQPIPR